MTRCKRVKSLRVTGVAPTDGIGEWSVVSGDALITATDGAEATVSVPCNSISVLAWTVTVTFENCIEPVIDEVSLTNEESCYPTIVMDDGKTWTATNLDDVLAGYEDETWVPQDVYGVEYPEYGKLYTWDAANAACEALGDGWRLPNIEDWINLFNAYPFKTDVCFLYSFQN